MDKVNSSVLQLTAPTDLKSLMDLQPHQKQALSQLSNGKILWGGVGSGKSRVAVAYYEKNEQTKNVYVITTAKKRDSKDWEGEFAEISVGRDTSGEICTESDMSMIPDSKYGTLVVDSWNNIDKYSEVQEAFFIFDEQRLVGSGRWVKAFLKIARNNHWILLTATPGDTWMDYIPVFIANGFYKNRTEFKLEHVVYAPYAKFPKVARYLNTSKLDKYRNQILVHMPYPKTTVRHSSTIWVAHNEELLRSIIKNRWHIYRNRPIRDIAELFQVMRRVVNSDPSRINAIRELLSQHNKLVVFYNFDYELDALRALGRDVATTEWNGHKHEEIPDTDSWVYLVQYVAGSEGWNCVETNTVIFHSLTYSYKNWEQAHGRIDRLNTPFIDLFYYVFRSKSIVDSAIWASLKAKKNFNAARFPMEMLK